MDRLFKSLVLVLLTATTIMGQQIQWASSVDYQYNQFDDADYSGLSATGQPDAFPMGFLNPKAFRLKSEKAFGSLMLEFEKPQAVQQLIIVESYSPGKVTKVALIDEKGNKYPIYAKAAANLEEKFRTLLISIPVTYYAVARVEIIVDTELAQGWAQIDAVGISTESSASDIKKTLQEKYGRLNIEDEIFFTSAKENLGETVNSLFPEAKPVISADGKTLYFARQNSDGNIGGQSDDQDIYVSYFENGAWTEAENIGEPLNDKFANGVCSVSPDGNTLLLMNAYSEAGAADRGVSISRKTPYGWEAPSPVVIHSFEPKGKYLDFFMSASEEALIVAYQAKEGGYGDQDLYVSLKQGNDTYAKPRNLGKMINTSKAEFSPYLAPDNKTLYFASNGHGGMGGSDIFYTKRLDDSWTNWSTPVNMGSNINTSDWDAYYSISADGSKAFFTSNDESSVGARDIYAISLENELKPEPVMLVKGRVLNSETNQPILADIIFEGYFDGKKEGMASPDSKSMEYKLILSRGNKYRLLAYAEGYVPVDLEMDIAAFDSYSELTKDIYLDPIALGDLITFNNILFNQSTPDLLPESGTDLVMLETLLRENPNMVVELAGHTDSWGDVSKNYKLSVDRVQVVKNHLTMRGIDARRLQVKGYGGSKPVASNATEESRQFNRRVEVKVLKNQ